MTQMITAAVSCLRNKSILLMALLFVSRVAAAQSPITATSPDGQPIAVPIPSTATAPCDHQGALFPVGSTTVACQTTFPVTVTQLPQFLWSTNATWSGAFKLPCASQCGPNGTYSFAYPGKGSAFNPANNSLFIAANSGAVNISTPELIAEVAIPTTLGTNPSDASTWPTATLLQGFSEPTEGGWRTIVNQCGKTITEGMLVQGGSLWFTEACYYDGASTQTVSHFKRPLNLSTMGSVVGPAGFRFNLQAFGSGGAPLTDYDRWMNGFVTRIPPAWQPLLGGDVLSGPLSENISGSTSQGPAVQAWSTATFQPGTNANLSTPLVYYTLQHEMVGGGYRACHTSLRNCAPPVVGQTNYSPPIGDPSTAWNGTTSPAGVVFIEGTSSVASFSIQGLGPECYGNAVNQTGSADDPFPSNWTTVDYCYDPVKGGKGNHAPPYRLQVQLYDAKDFEATIAGGSPWLPQPYETDGIDLPLALAAPSIVGVAYDPATQRIFLTEFRGSQGARVHVITLTVP